MPDFPPVVEKLEAGQWSVGAAVSVAVGSGRHLDVLSAGQAEPACCAVSYIYMHPERPHNVHTNEAGRRLQAHYHNETSPTSSFTPLYIQMLSSPGNVQWLAVCTVHCTSKLL